MKSKLLIFVACFICAFSLNAQIADTYVPDDNFEQALIDLGYDSGPLNDYVPTANISTLTSLNVSDSDIADLTGIEAFTSLEILLCYDNDLTGLNLSGNLALTELYAANNNLQADSLDVSQNTALEILYCYGNELTGLDVSQNTALTLLSCYENQLNLLDVTANTALTELRCKDNNLTSIDVSQNTALRVLSFSDNQIGSLDVKANMALTELIGANNILTSLDVSHKTSLEILNVYQNDLTSLTLYNNFALKQLYVAENNLSNLDVSQSTELEILYCFENELTSLDVSEKPLLTVLNCSDNLLTSLDVRKNTALTELECKVNGLTSLDISQNPALTVLRCDDNQLPDLDVSNNALLTSLICHSNGLSNLDVSNNIELTHLNCYGNVLTSLDVSNNTNLLELLCGYNQLTSMDVSLNSSLEHFRGPSNGLTSLNLKNGNNQNFTDEDIHIYDNPDLFCVEVDDASYSSTNWTTNVDDQIEFKTNCDDVLNSDYVILAKEKVELKYRNRVLSGKVGVTDHDGEAKFRWYSHVAESVEASEIYVSRSSSVGEEVLSPADVDFPEFIYNSVSDNSSPDVVVDYYQTVTLDGSDYGDIYVKYGGKVVFTNSNVNINRLRVHRSTTIDFDQCTNVYINKDLKLYRNTSFNPSGNSVFAYVDGKVQVYRGSDITASIYANDRDIKAKGKWRSSTTMKGMFIGKKIKGEKYVNWNMDANLALCSTPEVASAARVNTSINSKGETKTDLTVQIEKPVIKLDAFTVKTWPVPSNGNFNIMVSTQNESEIVLINVYDINGRLVHKDIFNANNQYQFGSNFKSGVYIVKINQASDNKTVRVIKN